MAATPLTHGPWPKRPTVLYLTTADAGYGKLHEEGLRKSLRGTDLHVEVVHEYLAHETDTTAAGYDEADMRRILDEAREKLQSGQVVAVVGPCGMATAKPLLDQVRRFSPDMPVMLESPVSRKKLGYPDGKPFEAIVPGEPVYRISSGLDERVSYIAALAKALLANDYRVTLLLEDTSYSVEIRDAVAAAVKDARPPRRLREIRVGKADAAADAAAAFDPTATDFVFYLGTGDRYVELAKAHVTADKPVMLAGVMNAWAFGGLSPALYPRLLDFEDIEVHWPGDTADKARADFEKVIGQIGPDTRDQAFSYDAGLCVSNAWSDAVTNKPVIGADYRACLRLIRQSLERPAGHRGVTGPIYFPPGGGQNKGLREHFVIHAAAPAAGGIVWQRVDEAQILALSKKLKEASR